MTLYESTEHGFSVENPEGWTEHSRGAGASFSFEFRDPEGHLAAEVGVEYKAENINLTDYVAEGKEYMAIMPQFEVSSEGDAAIGEGIAGYEIAGKGDLGTGEVESFRYAILVRDKQGFWVGARGDATAFDQQKELIDAIVDSFKLLSTYTFIPPVSTGGIYTSSEYGFSITYPEDWMEAPTGRPGEIISLSSAAGLLGVSISASPVGEETTLAEFGQQMSAGLAQHWGDYELVSEGEITLNDGTAAYEIVFSGTMEGYNLKSKYVIVIQGTQAFIIVGYSLPALFTQDEATIDEVIYSLHFE